jgi:hypothetical protein
LARDWFNSFLSSRRKLVLCVGATVCWTIWTTWNDAPISLIYGLCNMINSCLVLQKNQSRRNLGESMGRLKLAICEVNARCHGSTPATPRIMVGCWSRDLFCFWFSNVCLYFLLFLLDVFVGW